jgi:uncharacterized protein (TIGR02001 family)
MKRIALVAALAATTILPAIASAQSRDWSGSGNLSFVSDYRFRGISQTYRLPAVQGGFDLAHAAGFYAGTWASNVSGNQYYGGNSMELDIYFGYRLPLARNLSLDLGLINYIYPGSKNQFQSTVAGKRYDTQEVYAGLSWGNLSAKLNYAVSDFFSTADSSGSMYLDVNYNYPLSKSTNIVVHVGHQKIKNSDLSPNFGNNPTGTPPIRGISGDYTDYKLGATTEALGLTWGLAYVGNNAEDRAYSIASVADRSPKIVAKPTVVLSIGKTW